jgi:hypothetical protein
MPRSSRRILGRSRAADTDQDYPYCMGEKQRALRVGVLGDGPIAQAAHFEACRKAKNAAETAPAIIATAFPLDKETPLRCLCNI